MRVATDESNYMTQDWLGCKTGRYHYNHYSKDRTQSHQGGR